MRSLWIFGIPALFVLLTSCNRDGLITEEAEQKPVIELDSETGIYTVKAGRELEIAPTYKHAGGASYSWTVKGVLISSGPSLKHTWNTPGDVYVELRVDTSAGHTSEELKVEVVELAPPVISLFVPAQGLKALKNTDYTLTPDINNSELKGFEVKWILDGTVVGTEKAYTFNGKELGQYKLTIEASNIDGKAEKEIGIEVVETMPYKAEFPTLSYQQTSPGRNILAGQTAYLAPRTEYFIEPGYTWSVNGQVVEDETKPVFKFKPDTPGIYTVKVDVSETSGAEEGTARGMVRAMDGASAEITVNCIGKTQEDIRRRITASSSQTQDRVLEYTPAPGQFIGDTKTGGFTGKEKTPEDAIAYAAERLEKKLFVSLGGFGGCIVAGFDHSIRKTGNEYDFAIQGNAFTGSSEPGVVWVMQDANQNGKPDDEWYELKGSETGKDGTLQDYAVTYYRPAGVQMAVQWTDSEGASGSIDHLKTFHPQDYYYPAWIEEDSYTLRGTCLPARNTQDPETGEWINGDYDGGYADNLGKDRLAGGNASDGSGQKNGFKISNAVYPDGTAVDLDFIDFIKVQTAVNAKSGHIGELSTEVASFIDLSVDN